MGKLEFAGRTVEITPADGICIGSYAVLPAKYGHGK